MIPDWATASADEILAHLGDIDVEAFEALCDNPQFHEDHVRVMLEDPGLAPELVERISREARFFQKNSLRAAMALHPRMPRVRGLEMIRWLYWRDVMRVSLAPQVHPQVRVVADQILAERVPDLTLGERMTLARLGSRAVLRAMRLDQDPRVAEALLRNVRCTEEDVAFMAASSESHPQVLGVIARSRKWRVRTAVRDQLVRNRRLSLPMALGLLTELNRGELQAVLRQAELSPLVREAARRRLAEAPKRAGSG